MKIAVIGDIHGYLPGLEGALAIIKDMRCDRIVCVGDMIDGYPKNNHVVELLRMRTDIICLRGNHDEIDVPELDRGHRAWLLALPESLHLEGLDFFHFSPRRRDEKMNSVTSAWNAFDDAKFRNAVVGHAHIRALFRHRQGMGSEAEEVRSARIDLSFDATYRHIIVNPSLAYNRSGSDRPAFTIIDGTNESVRFVDLEIPPMDPRFRR